MRLHPIPLLSIVSIAVIAIAACDQSTTGGTIAGLGGTKSTTDTTAAAALIISPTQVQLAVGGKFQLSTNAPLNLQSQVQWRTSTATVAIVSATGLVTAIAPGAATVTARYVFDTSRVSSTAVNVVGTP